PIEVAHALEPFTKTIPPTAPTPATPKLTAPPPPPRSGRRKFLAAAILMAATGLGIGYWQPWAGDPSSGRRQPYINSIGMEFVYIPAEGVWCGVFSNSAG